jgi:hypothetical protein
MTELELIIKESGRSQIWYAKKMDINKDVLNRWVKGRSVIPINRLKELIELSK